MPFDPKTAHLIQEDLVKQLNIKPSALWSMDAETPDAKKLFEATFHSPTDKVAFMVVVPNGLMVDTEFCDNRQNVGSFIFAVQPSKTEQNKFEFFAITKSPEGKTLFCSNDLSEEDKKKLTLTFEQGNHYFDSKDMNHARWLIHIGLTNLGRELPSTIHIYLNHFIGEFENSIPNIRTQMLSHTLHNAGVQL